MITSEQVNEIFPAIVAAQGSTTNASKTSENPFFKSKYADLASIIEVTKKPLFDNGLAVIQSPSTDDGKVTITTRIIHKSGQWVEASLTFIVAKSDPQSVGSAITYGRRYSLASMLGITQEDDDGNAGSNKKEEPKKPVPSAAQKPKGTIQNAIDAIRAVKTSAELNGIKTKIPRSTWTEQEELIISDALTTKEQSLQEGKK